MTIEQRREMVRLAKLDHEEFGDADSLEVLLRLEQRLDNAIQAAEAAGEYRRIEPLSKSQKKSLKEILAKKPDDKIFLDVGQFRLV
jgi:hypothetical protein